MEKENKKQTATKISRFLAGLITVPVISDGIFYDIFGETSFSEIWYKLTHPQEIIENFGIYTLAYLTFKYLPKEIGQANWLLRFIYFILFYIILSYIFNLIF